MPFETCPFQFSAQTQILSRHLLIFDAEPTTRPTFEKKCHWNSKLPTHLQPFGSHSQSSRSIIYKAVAALRPAPISQEKLALSVSYILFFTEINCGFPWRDRECRWGSGQRNTRLLTEFNFLDGPEGEKGRMCSPCTLGSSNILTHSKTLDTFSKTPFLVRRFSLSSFCFAGFWSTKLRPCAAEKFSPVSIENPFWAGGHLETASQ